MEREFVTQLRKVQTIRGELLPEAVEVGEACGISRSFRRGSTSRATDQKVPERYINLINRWRSFERKGGGKPSFRMMDRYLDIRLNLNGMFTYSRSL